MYSPEGKRIHALFILEQHSKVKEERVCALWEVLARCFSEVLLQLAKAVEKME